MKKVNKLLNTGGASLRPTSRLQPHFASCVITRSIAARLIDIQNDYWNQSAVGSIDLEQCRALRSEVVMSLVAFYSR